MLQSQGWLNKSQMIQHPIQSTQVSPPTPLIVCTTADGSCTGSCRVFGLIQSVEAVLVKFSYCWSVKSYLKSSMWKVGCTVHGEPCWKVLLFESSSINARPLSSYRARIGIKHTYVPTLQGWLHLSVTTRIFHVVLTKPINKRMEFNSRVHPSYHPEWCHLMSHSRSLLCSIKLSMHAHIL